MTALTSMERKHSSVKEKREERGSRGGEKECG